MVATKKKKSGRVKGRYSKLIQKTCARCGKQWSPSCCDYSYKAVESALRRPNLTIPETNRLMDLQYRMKHKKQGKK